jgi:hypothetical protein
MVLSTLKANLLYQKYRRANFFIFFYANEIYTAIAGQARNTMNTISSQIKSRENINKSAIIKSVLKTIPINLENKTSPSLYSFFQGLKNVRSINGSEKR